MAFVRRIIDKFLDPTNLKKHNDNFADIEVDLSEHESRLLEANALITQLENRVTNLVVTAGDSGPEARDARVSASSGVTYSTLKVRLDTEMTNLMNFLNYMPVNGGSFDGDDPTGPVIDGGTY